MKRDGKKGRKYLIYIPICIFIGAIFLLIMIEDKIPRSIFKDSLGIVIKETKRILRVEKPEIHPEEKRIREEIILKKMEELNENQDWKDFFPEYPRSPKIENISEEERLNLLKNSKEFKEMKDELNRFLDKYEENLFEREVPTPSAKDIIELKNIKDKADEKVLESLLSPRAKISRDLPLEENIKLGIKGPISSRKILYRPPLPKVNIKTEVEIEMTIFVSPNGIVERVVPSTKGDSELEAIAMQYLKQWRFIPLEKDQPQIEQWGSIALKFKLQ